MSHIEVLGISSCKGPSEAESVFTDIYQCCKGPSLASLVLVLVKLISDQEAENILEIALNVLCRHRLQITPF